MDKCVGGEEALRAGAPPWGLTRLPQRTKTAFAPASTAPSPAVASCKGAFGLLFRSASGLSGVAMRAKGLTPWPCAPAPSRYRRR